MKSELEEPALSGSVPQAPPAPAAGSPAADTAAAPDWAATNESVLCPLCDYDLRGLGEPRCPECGYRFTWAEVLDPARRVHPYLFEHHPHRGIWAFGRTLIGGLRPRRFWTSLLPGQPGRPRRIVLYWLLAVLPLILTLLGSNVHRGWLYAAEMRRQRAVTQQIVAQQAEYRAQVVGAFGSVRAFFDAHMPHPGQWQFYRNLFRWQFLGNPRPIDKLLVSVIAWPWLTLLALLVFRISMRRARIRPVHVLRCVLYGGDVLFWIALVAVPAVAFQDYLLAKTAGAGGAFNRVSWPAQLFFPSPRDATETLLFAAVAAGILCLGYRLVAAYRHYLRFDRPAATILASQTIVLLVVWIVLVNWGQL